MTDLQNKILNAFSGKVVRKNLAFNVKGGLPVPTYVLEYLLGQYCASDDEDIIKDGVEKVKQIIQENYVHRAEAESVKGRIRENGHHRIIDKVTAVLNERADEYHASFANLGLTNVPIGTDYIKKNPKLLSGNGVWCIVNIGYISGDDVRVRWEIQNLKPIQISNVDLDDYINQRKNFTTDEWLDFMMHTVGLNPELMNRREKFITIARLLPHVENNFNFLELGPKGTGKTHVFQELSPFGVLVSGGDVTSARLFVRMSGNREVLGLVGYWDVVAWDEFEQQPGRSVDAKLIDIMQNYLANKAFNRGKATHEASASMVFVGNTKHTVPYMLKNTHLFESIPTPFIKGAFLDRIHLYNPGWEIRMLKKNSFSDSYGLISDYIAAILHEMRNKDLTSKLNDYVVFDGSLSERDHLAIRKTFSGMIKLLYPDGNMTQEEAIEIIEFAAECRKRVKDQLYIIDEIFKAEPAKFVYTILKTGQEKHITTLEYLENGVEETDINNTPDNENEQETQSSANETTEERQKRPRIGKTPANKSIDLRLNQKGVSYSSLFGDYLRTAKNIKVTDPFIRYPYQIDNLVDFIQTCRQCCENNEELKIHISTNNEDEKVPEMIDVFDDLKDELSTIGIELSYDFNADHDRLIELDNGWRIILGRGLDIYEKYERFSLGRTRLEDRRCKECTITFVQNRD